MNVSIADEKYTDTTTTIGEVLRALNVNDYTISIESKQPKKQNVRNDLLNELYLLYATAHDNQNRKNYYRYIRVHHPTELTKKEDYYLYKNEYRNATLPENVKYKPLIKKNDYRWWGRFSHLKGEDGTECLHVMVSEAKDIINRKENVILYILGACGKLSTDRLDRK